MELYFRETCHGFVLCTDVLSGRQSPFWKAWRALLVPVIHVCASLREFSSTASVASEQGPARNLQRQRGMAEARSGKCPTREATGPVSRFPPSRRGYLRSGPSEESQRSYRKLLERTNARVRLSANDDQEQERQQKDNVSGPSVGNSFLDRICMQFRDAPRCEGKWSPHRTLESRAGVRVLQNSGILSVQGLTGYIP